MAAAATAQSISPQMRQMSSDFMARRKIYEQEDTHLFYTTVTKVAPARSGSPHFFNATPKPASRKATAAAAATATERLSRIRSEESLRKRVSRNSMEVRPNVPRRSSSIRSNRNHRSKDLRSLHLQSHNIFSSLDDAAATATAELQQTNSSAVVNSGRNSFSIDRTSSHLAKVASLAETSAIQEDSPLSFTLDRKRSSLPPMEYKPDRKPSFVESRMAERDSAISHRDRESFLASFPQPPKSSHQRQVYAHRRNSSSQNYSLFPRSPPATETAFDKDGFRRSPRQSHEQQVIPESPQALPQIKDTALPARPSTARPAIDTTKFQTALMYDHPNLSFSNSDFSDAKLQLDLNPVSIGTVIGESSGKSSGARLKQDGVSALRKRAVNRWAFGSLGSERMSFSELRNDDEKTPMINGGSGRMQAVGIIPEQNEAPYQQYDEKHRQLRHANSYGGLRKKASSYLGLKEKNSSASMNNLLGQAIHGPVKPKKSLLKRIICW